MTNPARAMAFIVECLRWNGASMEREEAERVAAITLLVALRRDLDGRGQGARFLLRVVNRLRVIC